MQPSPAGDRGPPSPAAGATHAAGPDPPGPQGEELFRRAVEWMPFAMVMIDMQGRILLVNAQGEKVFGYRRDELVGRPVEMLVPERFAALHPKFRDGFRAEPRPRTMGSGRDLFGRRRDGSEFPVEIGLNPVRTAKGAMVLASIVDITERHRAQQKLEDALREKTVLLNEVHHRVKNNLQIICSLLNMQSSASADTQLHEILKEVEHRVRAMALTHQLIYERKDFARIDLGEYLQRLAQLLLGAYRGNSGRIALTCRLPAAPVTVDLVRAIPCALIVNELITNAFKHGFPGERRGEIVVALAADPAGGIELSVADDGVGLPAELTVETARSLGLQLVALLTEQLHGRIEAGGGHGTCFRLHFAGVRPEH